MQSLKNILEASILGDINVNIDRMDSDVENLNKFGYNFTFDNIASLSLERVCYMFNIKGLRNATKLLKPLEDGNNPNVLNNKYAYGKLNNEKIKLLLLWLDHVDISKFANADWTSKSTLREFMSYLSDLAKKQGIINKPQDVVIYVNNVNKNYKMEIFIYNLLKTNDMMGIRYK
jgi:hypothetical protein